MNARILSFPRLARLSALCALALGLFLTSCQRDELIEPSPVDEHASEAPTDAELRTFLLSSVYDIPLEQLSESASEDIYRTLTADLSEAEWAELTDHLGTINALRANTPEGKPSARAKSTTGTSISGSTEGYGQSVAVFGGYLFVGDPVANEVTVYLNQGNGYVVQQVLTPSTAGVSEYGKSLHAEATWLAVGSGTFESGGQVYLYKLAGGGFFGGSAEWTEQEVITTSDQIGFGRDVVLDFPYLAVLGRQANNPSSSEITVYRFFGQRWTEQTRLSDGDTFYWDIDMDNGWIAANSGQGPLGPLLNPQVFVYRRAGFFGSEWTLEQQIPFPPGQLLLRAVAIDGLNLIANTLVPGEQTFAYRLQGNQWVAAGTLDHPTIPAPFVQTRWLDLYGNTAVVCEPRGEFSPRAGDAVRVYERTGGSWQLVRSLFPEGDGFAPYFGVSPVVIGNRIYVGAPSDEMGTPGSIYLFD